MLTTSRGTQFTLPEGEEDNSLHGEELEDWVVLGEELSCGGVEENEAVQGKGHRDVVEKCAVEVAISWTKGKRRGGERGGEIFSQHCTPSRP